MHDGFAQQIDGWHDFYLLVGTASATLVGLLFVALTLNADILRSAEFGGVRALAQRSFFCFINLLTVSGIMLIPEQSPHGVGIPLVCVGGLSLFGALREIARHRSAERPWEALRRAGLMLLGTAALFAIGIAILSGWDDGLDWMTGAVLTLISAASQNAWELLTLSRTP